MKKLILLAFLAASAASAPQTYDQLEERDPTGQFVVHKATADEVRAKLGAPFAENRNRDGRFAYVYLSETNDYTTYLFDKTGVLIQVRSVPKTN